MPKDDVATIIIQNGLTHKVNVICKFSAQIDNQMFSFIIHRTLSAGVDMRLSVRQQAKELQFLIPVE